MEIGNLGYIQYLFFFRLDFQLILIFFIQKISIFKITKEGVSLTFNRNYLIFNLSLIGHLCFLSIKSDHLITKFVKNNLK